MDYQKMTLKLLKASIGLSFIICSACVASSTYDYGELVYANLDFEDGTHSPWEGQYTESQYEGEHHFKISLDPPSNGGNYSGRFYIGSDGDYWLSPNNGSETARSEIQLKSTAHEGEEIYYSWYFKIDESYVECDEWQIIGQFHDQPDPSIGESWSTYPANPPPLSYKYSNGQFIIAVYSFEESSVMHLIAVPITKGEWHQIRSRVFWSVTESGFMEFWLDGEQLKESGVTRYTARNCFNEAGNYLKIGLYRSKDIDSVGIVYFDNIKSGATLESIE